MISELVDRSSHRNVVTFSLHNLWVLKYYLYFNGAIGRDYKEAKFFKWQIVRASTS